MDEKEFLQSLGFNAESLDEALNIAPEGSKEREEGFEEARRYRQGVADGMADAMGETIDAPYAEVDGRKYVNVEVIAALGSVFVTRGMQAQLASMLTQDPQAKGAVAVYSEAATYLDVLHCLALGKPVNP